MTKKVFNKNDICSSRNILVTIGNKIMGKLGENGEVLDSINILPNYFLN